MNCSVEYLAEVEHSSTFVYVFFQALQTILCVLAPLIFVYWERRYRRVYLHANIKCLMNFYRFTTMMYCLSFSSIEIYHLFSRFYLSDCNLLVPVRICIWFRVIQSWSTVVFQLFFIAVVIEIVTRQIFKSLKDTKIVSRCLGVLIYIAGFRAVYPSIPIDLKSDRYLSNCASLENKNRDVLGSIFIFYFGMDVTSLLCFIFLKIYMEFAFSMEKCKYNVNKQIERTELNRAFTLMLPHAILHMLCFLYVSLVSMFVFSHFESLGNPQIQSLLTNAIPFYVFFSPIVWCLVLNTQLQKVDIRQVEKERDIYFGELAKQWGSKTAYSFPSSSESSKKPSFFELKCSRNTKKY
ncbi:unnamed protein product [Caenorhabditis angaria]|uniref:Uncharacterized protein n=1 Tax=Caenorhabditis angaria TaxID=860376 RepID=A0A9P1IRY1_9PELO|nr:unnamed protein product [Caenorhabditis angaria]